MKAFRLFLILAACLLIAEILRPIFSIPFDKNGPLFLIEGDDEMCAVPHDADKSNSPTRTISFHLA